MGQIRFLERKVACMQLTVPNYYSLTSKFFIIGIRT